MARGGKRAGAGRKPGSKAEATKQALSAAGEGEMPLHYMLRVMRDRAAEIWHFIAIAWLVLLSAISLGVPAFGLITRTLESRLAAVEDQLAIRDLTGRYNFAMDNRDLASASLLFTPDASFGSKDGAMRATGRRSRRSRGRSSSGRS